VIRSLVALGLIAVTFGCAKSKGDGGAPSTTTSDTASARQATLSRGTDPRLSRGTDPRLSRATDPKTTELPTYVVMPLGADEHVTIDGKLDEPAWQTALSTRDFVHPGNGQALPPNAPLGGSAKLRYDARALYIAVEARDGDLRGNFDRAASDPHLWTQDAVEIMLDPDGDGDNRDYYEIQVSPQGLVFDSQFDQYNSPRKLPDGPFGHQEWSSGIERAVVLRGTLNQPSDRDEGYVVEMALPFASLTKAKRVPPKPGDEWRVNFYVMENNGGVAWSPILGQGNFHKASRFGRLRFGP
jgi:hypothetical protein